MARLYKYTKDMHNTAQADLMLRVDLHYKAGTSDKVYILQVEREKNGTYTFTAYYGRNGNYSLTSQRYGNWPDYGSAKFALRKKQREKESKGYKLVHEEEPNGQKSISPLGIKPAIVANVAQKPLREVSQNTRISLNKLGSLKIPNMDTVDKISFLKRIKSDDIVMFNLPTLRFHYAFLEGYEWILYDAYDISKRPTPEYFPLDQTKLASQWVAPSQGLGWMGILDDSGQFIITDIVNVPGVSDVYRKEWRARRQMMNIAYDQLYPGVDPYDISNTLRFADYIYEDKVTAFNFGTGVFAAYNVKSTINGKFHVSNN